MSLDQKEKTNLQKFKEWVYLIPIELILLLAGFPFLIALLITYNPRNIFSDFEAKEWFIFFSQYIGGAFTLIAMYTTIQHNAKTVKETLEHNRRENQYQEDLKAIKEEEKVISEVVQSFDGNFLTSTYNCIERILTNNIELVTLDNSVYTNINAEHKILLSKKTKLFLESKICSYDFFCNGCDYIDYCRLGKNKKKFKEKYDYMFSEIWNYMVELSLFIEEKRDLNSLKNDYIFKKLGIDAKNITKNNTPELLSIAIDYIELMKDTAKSKRDGEYILDCGAKLPKGYKKPTSQFKFKKAKMDKYNNAPTNSSNAG